MIRGANRGTFQWQHPVLTGVLLGGVIVPGVNRKEKKKVKGGGERGKIGRRWGKRADPGAKVWGKLLGRAAAGCPEPQDPSKR